MALKKQPFINYTVETERKDKKRDIVAVSFDKKERAQLDHWKKLLDCPYDSTVLKMLSRWGAKVILANIPTEDLNYLISRERNRLGENLRGKIT